MRQRTHRVETLRGVTDGRSRRTGFKGSLHGGTQVPPGKVGHSVAVSLMVYIDGELHAGTAGGRWFPVIPGSGRPSPTSGSLAKRPDALLVSEEPDLGTCLIIVNQSPRPRPN